ncbi:MAG: T9SS type A sorting domain-containing protein [Bacteroidota bacterium]|nr:T9SS type A sorting domain-containing protein [Bacteroidota bacterium]
MKKIILSTLAVFSFYTEIIAQDLTITNVHVKKNIELKELVFTIEVSGLAGATTPTAIGMLDGAPVLGYVFPTTLNATDVGFDNTTGIVALGLTSHPDFDDTPLWDENVDANYANDGTIWHPHWVLLENNSSVPGGLAVKATTSLSILPPTNPGMPMYMDSPGFPVVTSGNKITCTVPFTRVNNNVNFNYDGVTALMKVNTSNMMLPMLGVYNVYSVASGSLSLPYSVGNHSCDTLFIDVTTSTGVIGLINPELVTIYPNPSANQVTLKVSSGLISGTHKVEIKNLLGTIVYQAPITSANTTISVSSIGSIGTYILNIVEISSSIIKGSKKLILN